MNNYFLNKSSLILLFTFTIFVQSGNCQEGSIEGEVMQPTFENNCEDGSIDLTITGGFPPYNVEWSFQSINPLIPQVFNFPPIIGIQGTNDGEDIDAPAALGVYTVLVTDALCGTAEASFPIECQCTECEINGSITNEKCSSENGAISTSLNCENSEMGSEYTYQWSDLGSDDSQSGNRENLAAGEYCLTITDENECSYTDCWTVEDVAGQLPRATLVNQTNIPYCVEGEPTPCTGALTIEVPEGATIEWLNIPNPNQENSNEITGLCVGVYEVEVLRDGCGFVWSFEIECCITEGQDSGTYVPPLVVELVEKISPTTATSFDGSISFDVSGGTSEYTISWSGSNASSSNTAINGLGPGEYCITVDDGCTVRSECITLVDCSSNNIFASGYVVNTCEGVAFGEIGLSITGGVYPLNITWSNGTTGLLNNNLAQGQYCVTITDDSGCDTKAIECFSVGLNSHQFGFNTSNPCGSQYTCNGIPSYFDQYTGPLSCGYENCNEWTCRCPLPNTGGIVGGTRDDGYLSTRFIPTDCLVEGLCRDGSGWETIVTGGINFFTGPMQLPDCNCVQCVEVEVCQITINGTQFSIPLSSMVVPLSDCGLGIENGNDDFSKSLIEFEYLLRMGGMMQDEEKLLVPKELPLDIDMVDYFEYIDTKIESRTPFEIKEITDEDRIVDIDCGPRICRNDQGETVSSDINNRSTDNSEIIQIQKNKIVCYPNPFKNDLSIEIFDDYELVYNFKIYNILGQSVLYGKLNTGDNVINSEKLESGTYILIVTSDGERFHSEKLIKN